MKNLDIPIMEGYWEKFLDAFKGGQVRIFDYQKYDRSIYEI